MRALALGTALALASAAQAYNLCSQMSRLGLSGTLTPGQIKHLVALLLDPASPVNE